MYRSSAFGPEPRASGNAAFVFTETLLGEEALDKWVGMVGAEPLPRGGLVARVFGKGNGGRDGGSFLPLDRAKPTFDAVVSAVLEQLPDRPLHEMNLTGPGTPWTGYELPRPEGQPEGQSEAYRNDVFIGSTAAFELTRAAAGGAFHSGRFSRFGETFCYLKLRHDDVPRSGWVDFRASFEDALDPTLRRAKAGCVYSNATGLASSYIDLALADVPRGIETIRQTLRPLGAPKQSWLLFCDREYAGEWVGVWDETPPPPEAGA
jgi:hypothetical protein